jgi:formamidopyrimidine-DNA glycosylase
MPELPEVESVRRSLLPHIVGCRVRSVSLRRRDVCESHRNGKSASTRDTDLLAGGEVVELRRRGKQLAIIAGDGRAICIHLGMTGHLEWRRDQPGDEKHLHVVWELQHENRPSGWLAFRDPRRFGGVWTFESVADLERVRWSVLGDDGLEITGARLWSGLRGSRRAVKAAILDQGVVAGVGNIYADEALFAAGIRPQRRCTRLKEPEVMALASTIRATLAKAVEAGGSTIRDYSDGNGEAGRAQEGHRVYGRAGLPCTRCDAALVGCQVAQRTTVWCRGCQR